MTPKEISKAIAETFDGEELERGKFLLREFSHWYIEMMKLPALKLGLGEEWADRTKYILGYGLPLLGVYGIPGTAIIAVLALL